MSDFQQTLKTAVVKEDRVGWLHSLLTAAIGIGLSALILAGPPTIAFSFDPFSFSYALGVVLLLWDEPIWNEPWGRGCTWLARGQSAWGLFVGYLVFICGRPATVASQMSSLWLVGSYVMAMQGRALGKPLRILFAIGTLLLVVTTHIFAFSLLILLPFLHIVSVETISRTKGRLEKAPRVWIPFSLLMLLVMRIGLLTTL